MKTRLLLLTTLALLPLAGAHAAKAPDDHYTRLLHDCTDDWFGGDDGGGIDSGRPGYDLHTLETREAWNTALGHHLVFKIILNGDGATTITLDLKADGSAKNYDFTKSGGAWSGTFDAVKHIEDIGDGDRFALEGSVKRSTLGVSVGDKLTDYTLTGKNGGEEHDHVPGNDATVGACGSDKYESPDYTLKGPTHYFDATLEETDVTTKAGVEKLVTLELKNKLLDNGQRVTLKVDGARLHDPNTGDYIEEKTFDFNKRGSSGAGSFIHVAIEGDEATTGTVTLTITSSLGGYAQRTIDYEITPGESSGGDGDGTQDGTDGGAGSGEDSPGLAPVAAILALAFLVWRRR